MTIENLKKANILNSKIENVKRGLANCKSPQPYREEFSSLTQAQALQMEALYIGFLEVNIKAFQTELDAL